MIQSKSILPGPLIQLQVFSNYLYLEIIQIHPISNSKSSRTTPTPANCSFGALEFGAIFV